MGKFDKFLVETKKEDPKVVFIDEDPKARLPFDVMIHLKKQINKKAKDLSIKWKNAVDLVDSVLEDDNISKPELFHKDRWDQYVILISHSVKNLHDARGAGNWMVSF